MSLMRDFLRSSSTSSRHASTWARLQQEAAARPSSTLVQTPSGGIWLFPIESQLYEAMVAEGLAPVPQYCVEGYFADFAFPASPSRRRCLPRRRGEEPRPQTGLDPQERRVDP